MYADRITDSMRYAIDETNRRRSLQHKFNEEHGITPKSIQKDIHEIIEISVPEKKGKEFGQMSKRERLQLIEKLRRSMKNAAKMLEFEYAAELRDQIAQLEQMDTRLKSSRQ